MAKQSGLRIPDPFNSISHTVRVRYAETDQAGMAHHSAFLPWFEEGRVELLRSLGKPYHSMFKFLDLDFCNPLKIKDLQE